MYHTEISDVVPFTFPMSIKAVSTMLNFISSSNETIATLTGGQQPAQNGVLQILDVNEFSSIIHDQILLKSAIFTGRGNATASVQTPIGLVSISGISFQQNFTLEGPPHSPLIPGSQGFATSTPVLGNAAVTGSDTGGLYLDIPITLYNPSNILASVGTIYFQITHNNEPLGTATLNSFVASEGNISTTSHVYVNWDKTNSGASAAGRDLLSNFAMGKAVQTGFEGTQGNSTNIPFLKSGLAGISLSAETPGLTTKLITGAKLNLGLLSLFENGISADVSITNRGSPGWG
jgi:hypothetical protein